MAKSPKKYEGKKAALKDYIVYDTIYMTSFLK